MVHPKRKIPSLFAHVEHQRRQFLVSLNQFYKEIQYKCLRALVMYVDPCVQEKRALDFQRHYHVTDPFIKRLGLEAELQVIYE